MSTQLIFRHNSELSLLRSDHVEEKSPGGVLIIKDFFQSERKRERNKELIILFLPQDIAMSACVDEKCDFNLATRRVVSHRENCWVEDERYLVLSWHHRVTGFLSNFLLLRPRKKKKEMFPLTLILFWVLRSVMGHSILTDSLPISLFIFVLLDLTRTERYEEVSCHCYFPLFQPVFDF